MQAPVVLCGESASTRHLLCLLLSVPVHRYLGSDCAAICFCTFERKLNPLTLRINGVLVHQHWPALVRDDHIEDSAVPQVRHRHGAAIVDVCDSHRLSNINKLTCSIVEPHVLLLIPRETAAVHSGPVSSVSDD